MTVIVSRERRERLQWIKRELDRVDRAAARNLYDWGVLFGEIERDELWREDDSTSFSAWVEDETPYSFRTARRAIEVSQHFTLEMCERWGAVKLAAAMRYVALTKRHEKPGDVTALAIRYREPSGRYTSVPFATAEAKLIEAACAQLEKDAKGRRDNEREKQVDDHVRARVVRLLTELPKAPRGTSRGERVTFHKGTDGELAVTFKAIPVSGLAEFIDAARKHLL